MALALVRPWILRVYLDLCSIVFYRYRSLDLCSLDIPTILVR
jgi:hypothetical protein